MPDVLMISFALVSVHFCLSVFVDFTD